MGIQPERARDHLHKIFTQVFLGDSLAADYLICHLISHVSVNFLIEKPISLDVSLYFSLYFQAHSSRCFVFGKISFQFMENSYKSFPRIYN